MPRRFSALRLIFVLLVPLFFLVSPHYSTAAELAEERGRYLLSAGPGLLLWNDNAGLAVNLDAVLRTTPTSSLYLGMNLGFNLFSLNSGSTSVKTSGLQILPTAFYVFGEDRGWNANPFAGIAVGVDLIHTTVTPSKVLSASSLVQAGSKTLFEGLVRSGMMFHLSPRASLNTELRFGLLSNKLLVNPLLSAAMAL